MSPYRDDEDYWHAEPVQPAPRGPLRYLGYAFLAALGLWVSLLFFGMAIAS